jgi:S-ribosylhomocysteine lyase
MTAPNRQPALSVSALHAIEHLAATYLRNRQDWKDKIVYWGPMGCCTGNYLLVKGTPTPNEIRLLMIDTFDYILKFEGQIPGASPRDCGNYLLMSLPEAKMAAQNYLEVLRSEDCPLEYPKN